MVMSVRKVTGPIVTAAIILVVFPRQCILSGTSGAFVPLPDGALRYLHRRPPAAGRIAPCRSERMSSSAR